MQVVALVPVAGRGDRPGTDVPGALVSVGGAPLLVHAVNGLLESGRVHQVVAAAAPSDVDTVTAALASAGAAVRVVTGGPGESLRAALASAPEAGVALVHDATRAFTPPELVGTVVDAVLAGGRVVIPVLPVTDTVKRVDPDGRVLATPDRAGLRTVQTPQGFAVDVLRAAPDLADLVGAAGGAALADRLDEKIVTVPGHPYAMRIATPFDLAVAEALLSGPDRSTSG
ncbi:2-C-methyl-D-erythritol 4-phosphate cytidylyltransferase [Gandjariella thermophila]|uniref:2-C-methyl-D-erythritol 4-phosphate cytidylyltransferase n=1 Tax=Gandjariella thermophila TaxID=1931992 RepID=UPI0010FA1DBA|nr:2-C-methyl-D-erythritol 4-phosphate cytidylyltransferase [Gandjariella thermophila]